jgi:ankyrin repeat protein
LKLARLTALALMILAIVAGTESADGQDSKMADVDRKLLNATVNADLATVRILLDNGGSVETKDANGSTLLVLAAESNDVAIVKLLLEKGADASAKDQQGETALINAARSGGTDVVGMLAEKTSAAREKELALFAVLGGMGSVVVVRISDDPNEVAAKQTRKPQPEPEDAPGFQTVKLLLDKGVAIDARDEDGSTPLITAAGYGETEIVRLLLERGSDLRARDKYGLTPLMAASCQCGSSTMNDTYDIVKLLLEKGAAVNGRDHDGETALMLASGMAGDPAVSKLLLDAGADPAAKNKHGDTALALAIKSHRQDKVQILKQAAVHAH